MLEVKSLKKDFGGFHAVKGSFLRGGGRGSWIPRFEWRREVDLSEAAIADAIGISRSSAYVYLKSVRPEYSRK